MTSSFRRRRLTPPPRSPAPVAPAREPPVLADDERREAEGHHDEDHVEAGEAGHAAVDDVRAEEDDTRGEHVARAHEERVDRLLGLVLLLAARRQPDHLLRRVHHRVVGAVLGHLHVEEDAERGAGRGAAVGAEGDDRQRVERPAQAEPLDQPRDHERLQRDRGEVREQEVSAVEGADERLAVERGVERLLRVGARDHGLRQDELADRVHDVEGHEQQRDEPQVGALQHEREAVAGLHRLDGRTAGPRPHPRRDHAVEDEVHRQEHGGELHHQERAQPEAEQPARQRGPERRAGRRPDRDQREQPVALGARVDLVRVRPELRDRGQAEDPHPDEEDEPQVGEPRLVREVEELDTGDEEEYHRREESLPRQLLCRPAVQRHVADQRQGLRRGGVRLQLRAAREQDEGLADGLEDVVRRQQQEDAQAHEEDGRAFPGPDVAEQPQGAVERPGRTPVVWPCGCLSGVRHRCSSDPGRVAGSSHAIWPLSARSVPGGRGR